MRIEPPTPPGGASHPPARMALNFKFHFPRCSLFSNGCSPRRLRPDLIMPELKAPSCFQLQVIYS